MRNWFSHWFKLDQFKTYTERNRAWFLSLILVLLMVNAVFRSASDLLTFEPQASVLISLAGSVFLGVTAFVGMLMLRRGAVHAAANLITLGLLVTLSMTLWLFRVDSLVAGLVILGSIALVATVTRPLLAFFYTLLLVVYAGVMLAAEATGQIVPAEIESPLLLSVLVLVFVALLVVWAMTMLVGNFRRFSDSVSRQTQTAELIALMNEHLADSLDRAWILSHAIDVFLDTLPQLDLVRIYRVDGDEIILAASSDPVDTGRLDGTAAWPLAHSHRLGRVALNAQPLLMRNVDIQAAERLELLASTHTVLTLPMRIGQMVVGVVECQSSQENALDEEDVRRLTVLVELTTAAIERARRFAEVEQQAAAHRHEAEALAAVLARLRSENADRVLEAWNAYLQDTGLGQNIVMDFEKNETTYDTTWTPALEAAVDRREVVAIKQPSDQSVIGVPIWVSGQIVGAMEFELEGTPSAQQLELARQVGERLGLAADNTRLFAEAERIAARETMVNQIGADLQAVNDMESALVTAAQGLTNILGVPRVSVRLGLPGDLPTDADLDGGVV